MALGLYSSPAATSQFSCGNIEAYARVCESAREEAFERMVEHAREHGTDALVAKRYDATEFAPGVTEVLAYGTAVKLAPDDSRA